MSERDDFTGRQLGPDGKSKWAVFLPAVSGAHAFIVGKYKCNPDSIPLERIPPGIPDVAGLDWLDSNRGLFTYKWSLYSAGHASLDLNKQVPSEEMIRGREKGSFLLTDSGGYQIATGKWPADWKAGSGCKVADKKRTDVMTWLDSQGDYSMVLDIPTWLVNRPDSVKATQITTHEEAVEATKYNNDYFMDNRIGYKNGGAKFLNVLQGANHTDADEWYDTMKHYCDPGKHPNNHFNGWAMGAQNMSDMHLVLHRLVSLQYDGFLQEGIHDWIHFLGTSRLEWALMFSDIQRSIREFVNPNLTISFDCASPFLTAANGQIYCGESLLHNKRWTYPMCKAIDDRRFSSETRSYGEILLEEGMTDRFKDSIISKNLQAKDVCYYKPGQENRQGKVSKTSWDSFSYCLLMAHNVWTHIDAVQSANELYDKGHMWPSALRYQRGDHEQFKNIVNEIFSASSREKAEKIIANYETYWTDIRGGRMKSAKKPDTMYKQLFSFE